MRRAELRRGVSARTRILAWIMLVLTIAVFLIVATTAQAELNRVQVRADEELRHEVEKFREFAARTDVQDPSSTIHSVLTAHLQTNLPEHTETFFTIIDGQPDQRSGDTPPLRLDRDPGFVARAAAVTTPMTSEMTTSAGRIAYAVVPVQAEGQPARAHLVIIEFLDSDYAEAWDTIWTMSTIALISLIVAGFFGWLVAGRVLAPIRQLRETASRISEKDFSERIEVTGTDDVAHLGDTFNRMLDRLQAAFDGQRQFLDDAGHELRTPITVVRGHLDVMGDDPVDRDRTLELVDDELRRMSRLVDELVMLAGSERPDFLVRARTDLTDLIVSSFSKATALAPRRWVIDDAPEAFGIVDEQRLAQALLQLAANSVDHTDETDTIAFGGRIVRDPALGDQAHTDQALGDQAHTDQAHGNRLELWVRDTGSGVSADDRDRIFQRFVRAKRPTGRRRGTGLGLTIVERIARAHGGEVRVDSVEGEGATFLLSLPWIQEESGDHR